MRPRIVQSDGQIGFFWATSRGVPTSLQALVVDDEEPDRLAATHLEALDDALIIAAERFGEILGGDGDHVGRTNATTCSTCTARSTDSVSTMRLPQTTSASPQTCGRERSSVPPRCSRSAPAVLSAYSGPLHLRANSTSRRWGWSAVSASCTASTRISRGAVADGWCEPNPDNVFHSPCPC